MIHVLGGHSYEKFFENFLYCVVAQKIPTIQEPKLAIKLQL